MKEKTIQQLLVFLLSQDRFTTTTEIGQALNISKRTILNHMDSVRTVCQENGLELVAKRGKGYFIEGDETFKRSLAQMNLQVNLSAAFKQERLMYVLYLLLYDQDECRISELESILHISRPSIYRLLDEVEEWLGKYKIDLIRTRDRGIYKKSGEKRHRLAMAHWYFDCITFLESQKSNPMYMDVLKLRKGTQELDGVIDPEGIIEVINQMKRVLNVDIAKVEYQWLAKIMQISFCRITEGKKVSLPDSRKRLYEAMDTDKSQITLVGLIWETCNLQIPPEEVLYLLSMILSSSSLVGDTYQGLDFEMDPELLEELKEYLHAQLAIREQEITVFLENYKYLLKNEILYQIKEPNLVGDKYYKQLADAFHVVAVIAKEVIKKTYKVYPLVNSNKFLSNSIFLLLNAIDRNKEKLKTALLYDCNVIELIFIKSRLQMYFPFMELKGFFTKGEIQIDPNKLVGYDLVLATYKAGDIEIPVLEISKALKSQEINYLNEITNHLYQEKNFSKIIKDSSHKLPNPV